MDNTNSKQPAGKKSRQEKQLMEVLQGAGVSHASEVGGKIPDNSPHVTVAIDLGTTYCGSGKAGHVYFLQPKII